VGAGLRKGATSKTLKMAESIDPFQSGGLNDEDAQAVHPSFAHDWRAPAVPPSVPKRDPSRKNDVRYSLVTICILLILSL